ncbi:MAG: 16S rRNA (uracil(1498)-N(3))-methyltransferase [Legionellaceae bacterium]|nr:16S rRNA (uracil(1498)-N(3))-methyltransferase [Legionellaceae bacterium]MBP9774513.1 16S rRNA (uracil(1498)-N(3))-methyltransferase [Legionellaceae bacterium]
MRTIRIYQPGHYQLGQTLTLSEAGAQHVGLVLRLPEGANITLFCGDNYEYQAIITSIHKKRIQVCIEKVTLVNRESPRGIHLAQGIAKGDKMEWIIQKAVELGVASITPIVTDRSVVRLDANRLEKKQHQWQAISISACEQSGRNHIPTIHPTCSFEHFLQHSGAQFKWMLSPQAQQSWPEIPEYSAELALLVGPEGGFSPQELTYAEQHQVQGICLGPRILRTETAAITAIGILQMLYGDL